MKSSLIIFTTIILHSTILSKCYSNWNSLRNKIVWKSDELGKDIFGDSTKDVLVKGILKALRHHQENSEIPFVDSLIDWNWGFGLLIFSFLWNRTKLSLHYSVDSFLMKLTYP